ncbi:acyl carrier protein [Dactylosporangium roseum]|uniref:Acyl carrier protein n=1 Tax=Dactylosporangium roseum TaxID=47989 RepID=A0ABY5ZBG6_9ACTN|nr:acyl carrier protein [Dactylosporangium roseum]UWZ39399.1 acyl carrier protein [Dactylosporangium roseum]
MSSAVQRAASGGGEAGTPWPPSFETIVRAFLPALPPTTPLLPDTPLADYGLDSLAVVGLIVEIEDAYGFEFPEETVIPQTFYDPTALWTVVAPVVGQRLSLARGPLTQSRGQPPW